MIIKVIEAHYIRKGLWGIIYTAECECGCTKTRHIAEYAQKTKPADSRAIQIANDHYNQR